MIKRMKSLLFAFTLGAATIFGFWYLLISLYVALPVSFGLAGILVLAGTNDKLRSQFLIDFGLLIFLLGGIMFLILNSTGPMNN